MAIKFGEAEFGTLTKQEGTPVEKSLPDVYADVESEPAAYHRRRRTPKLFRNFESDVCEVQSKFAHMGGGRKLTFYARANNNARGGKFCRNGKGLISIKGRRNT